MFRQIIRAFGALLVGIGVLILAGAALTYFRTLQAEEGLEAQIPGVEERLTPTTTAVVLMPALDGAPVGASADGSLNANVSEAPSPDATRPPATVAPTAIALDGAPQDNPDSGTSNAASTSGSSGANSNSDTKSAAPTVASVGPTGVPRGQGAPAARIVIPKLKMDLPVRQADYVTFEQNGQVVSDWNVPYDAAGHLSTTAFPGENGNAVFSGHHNLVGPGKFGLGAFAGLWNLAVGDEIRIETEDELVQLWRVTESFPLKEGGEPLSVRIQHAQQILGDTQFPRLTLVTCWNGKEKPLSGNTYRWIIISELVSVNHKGN